MHGMRKVKRLPAAYAAGIQKHLLHVAGILRSNMHHGIIFSRINFFPW
jgi:hypothetical protein